jgi:hypothetical protein
LLFPCSLGTFLPFVVFLCFAIPLLKLIFLPVLFFAMCWRFGIQCWSWEEASKHHAPS